MRQREVPKSSGGCALQDQRQDHDCERETAYGSHAPEYPEVEPARGEQPAEEGDDGQLREPQGLDAWNVRSHHPLDCVLLLLQVEGVKVLAISPRD